MKYIFILLFFISCTSLKTKMEAWLGKNSDELTTQFGLPDRKVQDGSETVYIYQDARYAGTNANLYRFTSFWVSRHGIITKYNVRETSVPIESITIRIISQSF